MAGLVRFTEEVSCQPDTCLASQALTRATVRALRWIHVQAPICGVSWKVFSFFPRDSELGILMVNVVLALEEALVVFSLSFFCLFHNMTEAHSPDGLFFGDRIGRTFLNQRKMEVKEWATELAQIMTGEAKSFGQRGGP